MCIVNQKKLFKLTDFRTQSESEKLSKQSSTVTSVKSENVVKNQSSVTSFIQEDTNLTEESTSSSSKFCKKYWLWHNVSGIIFQNNRHNMKMYKLF